jgi:2-polyprenyl-6-methoxyphenol hydroxylase-like FAD-dependent oxidoreductase
VTDVVIIGGGLVGLATALFCARRRHNVVVLERDFPPDGTNADDDFNRWNRPGLAQARQSHAFLARSTLVLQEEAPDVLAAIIARGAVSLPVGSDTTSNMLLARRLVYEGVLRRAVEREPGVTIRSGVLAANLLVDSSVGAVPVVKGVRTSGGEDLCARLVVDCGGRSSRAPQWLSLIGRQLPETRQECGFFYLTRHYRVRDGRSSPVPQWPNVVSLDYASVHAFPADNRTFSLSVTVGVHDPCRHRVREGRSYDRFLAAVPLTAPWIDCGVPLDDPRPLARIENRWRRLVDERGAPIVHGFALVGDAAMQTNPTLGRGVSLGFAHAQQFARSIGQADADPAAFITGFEAWTTKHLGVWFEVQVANDRARLARLGEGSLAVPPNRIDSFDRLAGALSALRERDPIVRDAYMRAYNLLITPGELISDRQVLRRLNAYLKANPVASASVQQGPDRSTFERLVAS